METIFLGIVVFLIVLAVFDLVVGVSNDAVNFINSAIGAKAASFKVIIAVAAVGVFAGASVSNGMMDVARHGIFNPDYYTFYEVMCIFLAVMVTDVVLLDVFNTLGMPTSTTVSMVFELLGGSFALALLKMLHKETDEAGSFLSLNELLNSDKALSVILAIFLSVAVAFVFGIVVQWLSRVWFTFTYNKNSRIKTGIFGGLAVTCIIWFLLINGLKGTTLMTEETKAFIDANKWIIISSCIVAFSAIMLALSYFKFNVLKFVVLLGTFALAMAFAGNDLVNFIGVPLSGLDSFIDFKANGNGDPNGFLMRSLSESAQTPMIFLIGAGLVMVLSLIFSKKAQNVVKTSVDLSRQDEGDEMFGSSAVARTLVRTTSKAGAKIASLVPKNISKWIDTRFNSDDAIIADGAAFDMIRASINLVLAGLLVAMGTSLKLPLSTTYVTFMVAMGSSLADRAWSRESAVFRITGVLSVIGGWFITAGVAFFICFAVTSAMYFGQFIVMALMIVIAIVILVRSNIKYSKKSQNEVGDVVFSKMVKSHDKRETWNLLCSHVRENNTARLETMKDIYTTITDAFFHEEYRRLKRAKSSIEEEQKEWKRQRRREIIGLRRIDPLYALERNTWFFLENNSCEQMLYCLKRINDPSKEHIGNNFTPVSAEYFDPFLAVRDEIVKIFDRTKQMLTDNDFDKAEIIRDDCQSLQRNLSKYRQSLLDDIQDKSTNLEAMLVLVNIVQESQELIGALRHMIRGVHKFQEGA